MSGKLTAEQVREIVEKHWHDLPVEYDMPESSALPEYSYDWQAIADELNAALGGEECEDAGTRFNAWVCSKCKATLLLMFDDYDEPTYSVDGVADVPRHCPNCGRKVK